MACFINKFLPYNHSLSQISLLFFSQRTPLPKAISLADGEPKTLPILLPSLSHTVLKNKAVLRSCKHGAVRFPFFTPCAQGSRDFQCVWFEETYRMAV